MPKDHAPRLIATRGLAVTALFNLQEDRVLFCNGVERRLERIEQRSGAAVMVIPLLGDRVVLVREYGAGSRQYELAFPTGTPLPGETIEETADRELREEVGHGASRFFRLGMIKSLPGQLDHVTNVVMAQDLYPAPLPGDEPEPVQVLCVTRPEAWALVEAGQLNEARSVAAWLLAERASGHWPLNGIDPIASKREEFAESCASDVTFPTGRGRAPFGEGV